MQLIDIENQKKWRGNQQDNNFDKNDKFPYEMEMRFNFKTLLFL